MDRAQSRGSVGSSPSTLSSEWPREHEGALIGSVALSTVPPGGQNRQAVNPDRIAEQRKIGAQRWGDGA